MADINVSMVAFAFQLPGVDVVMAIFMGVSATRSVFLLRQPVFASVARVSRWPFLVS